MKVKAAAEEPNRNMTIVTMLGLKVAEGLHQGPNSEMTPPTLGFEPATSWS